MSFDALLNKWGSRLVTGPCGSAGNHRLKVLNAEGFSIIHPDALDTKF